VPMWYVSVSFSQSVQRATCDYQSWAPSDGRQVTSVGQLKFTACTTDTREVNGVSVDLRGNLRCIQSAACQPTHCRSLTNSTDRSFSRNFASRSRRCYSFPNHCVSTFSTPVLISTAGQ